MAIVLYTLMSLDGAVDDPRRYFPETGRDTGPPAVDQELGDREQELLDRQTAVLLGRGMYDQWSQYWPTSDEQPFADFINGVRKYVVTSSPLTGGWANAEAVSGPLPEVVHEVQSHTDGDVGVHGSITLAKALLKQRLVDELCLSVGRVLDPVGRRLFDSVPDLQVMELLEATPTSTGSLWLRYRLSR